MHNNLIQNSIMNKIERDGFQIRFCLEGKGHPALVIGSALYYQRVFSLNIRKYLSLIFMDHRGFSIPPSRLLERSDYELEVLVDDVEHLRRHLKKEKVIIIGHSGNAYIALEYAKKYPEHVSHVVMLGCIPSLSLDNQASIEKYWADHASDDRKEALRCREQKLPDEKLSHLGMSQQFIQQCLRSSARIWHDFHFDASYLWDEIDINMEIFDYIWGNVFRNIDITKGLENFKIPVFLGLGRQDFLAPYHLWNDIKEKFKNIQICIFEKSGHTPQFEEPAIFDRKLIEWISNDNEQDQSLK